MEDILYNKTFYKKEMISHIREILLYHMLFNTEYFFNKVII